MRLCIADAAGAPRRLVCAARLDQGVRCRQGVSGVAMQGAGLFECLRGQRPLLALHMVLAGAPAPVSAGMGADIGADIGASFGILARRGSGAGRVWENEGHGAMASAAGNAAPARSEVVARA